MTRLSILAGMAFVAFAIDAAAAAELQVDKATITGGRLVITGRTAKPNQVVVLVDTGDRTASMPSRRFSFAVSYFPETCKIHLRAGTEDLKDQPVAGCAPRGKDGKDGADGKNGADGKDGKDGKDGFVYGSLLGDGSTFKCWPSDLIGLWFIKDYPAPNSRTIAHIVPDRVAGGNKLNVTEPDSPLKSEQPDGPAVTRSAEFDKEKLYILNRETNARTGVRGDVAPDCRSIVWKGDGDGILKTWER